MEAKIKKKPMKKKTIKKSATRTKTVKKAAPSTKDKNIFKKKINDVKRSGTPALEVLELSKKYRGNKEYSIKDLNFNVYSGEFHGFIGANGAGKTTTIKSIIGAYAKFEGKIKIFGKKHSHISAKKLVGYIPEAANFPKKFSALEYITYMSYLSGMTKKEAKLFAKRRLNDVGLGPISRKSPNDFSSGQKKKVLLAQALVHDPDLVVMDEPAANLDPQARIEFFDNLKFLRKEGKAIFISSHILAELDKYVDSVTILDGGKIVYTGTVADLTQNPKLTYRLITDKDAEIQQYLKKHKIHTRRSNDNDHVILADMLEVKNIRALLKFIVTKNIIVKEFRNDIISLDEVYEHYVKYGSMQTLGQDVHTRKLSAKQKGAYNG